ncbi:alpha/beta hydrolase family protein [Calidifontibacter terrae]
MIDAKEQHAEIREIDTPGGPARAHIVGPDQPIGTLVLTHGAGGGIEASDLVALAAMVDDGWRYVRVEMPWRVAGKRVASPPASLDKAWLPILADLADVVVGPLVVGGRSAGARVACRTAAAVGADAVLALSFPLRPPGKPPEKTRAPEAMLVLDAGRPLLVVQGESDPFGSPAAVRAQLGPRARVVGCRGTHSFPAHPLEVVTAVREWLSGMK